MNSYDAKYGKEEYYWGKVPSKTCYRILELAPPVKEMKVLDIGCGEGRNAVFLARNGYKVKGFDLSQNGLDKTEQLAKDVGVNVEVFKADVNEYLLREEYDILFSTGVLHYIPKEKRTDIFSNYKVRTNPGGYNAFSVFVNKPFIGPAPDGEPNAQKWLSGELFGYYWDWEILYCTEEIFVCNSGGVPHKHATNRIIARKPLAIEGEDL